jgi:hypothetical protein
MGGMIKAAILTLLGLGILMGLLWGLVWLFGVVFWAPFR